MLDYDQRKKLVNEWNWGDNKQQKADFNKKMRRKLKLWLKEIPDMTLILQGLPQRVIENANLLDDLPNIVNFMDAFLEKANPLPVGEDESGQKSVFLNRAFECNDSDSRATRVGDEDFLIDSWHWKATPKEIDDWVLLRTHSEKIQRFIDPSTVVITSDDRMVPNFDAFLYTLNSRANYVGAFSFGIDAIEPGGSIKIKEPQQTKFVDYRKRDSLVHK